MIHEVPCGRGRNDDGNSKPISPSFGSLPAQPLALAHPAVSAARASMFPRLRYMGSKYRLVPELAQVFAEIGGTTALDAFSGSGVVAYTLRLWAMPSQPTTF